MKKKLLVIGGSGLVGSTLINYSYKNYDVHYTFNDNMIQFDNIPNTKIELLNDIHKLLKLIDEYRPHVIIHTVAHPSVDECERSPEMAKKLHVDITKEISKISAKINSKLIYFSTDAVFDGQTQEKYLESDIPNPINYYGKTKLEAEKIVQNSSSKNVILRPAVIYGWHKKSRFTNWIIESLQNGNIVDPHIDQYNTPTLVDDLVNSIIQIIEKDISGLFHSTGKTCVNRYELSIIIAEIFGFDKKLIRPVTSIEKKQYAPRPVNTCLDSTKLEKATNYQFKNIKEGIRFLFAKSKKNESILSSNQKGHSI